MAKLESGNTGNRQGNNIYSNHHVVNPLSNNDKVNSSSEVRSSTAKKNMLHRWKFTIWRQLVLKTFTKEKKKE